MHLQHHGGHAVVLGCGQAEVGNEIEAAVRALAKVTQVIPARLRRRAESLAAVTESVTWGLPRNPWTRTSGHCPSRGIAHLPSH